VVKKVRVLYQCGVSKAPETLSSLENEYGKNRQKVFGSDIGPGFLVNLVRE
jgi:hypothetical protein